jgi:TolA-binding protein
MSKAFAEEILLIQDQQRLRSIVQQRRKDVDEQFVAFFLQIAADGQRIGEFDVAIVRMRTLYVSGAAIGSHHIMARATYSVALIEASRGDFKKSADRLVNCIAECEKSPQDCTDLMIDALLRLSPLQESDGQIDKATATLQRAIDLLRRLGRQAEAQEVGARIEAIRSAATRVPPQPLQDVLNELATARASMSTVNADLQQAKEALTATSEHLTSTKTELTSLETQQRSLKKKLEQLKAQIEQTVATLTPLELRRQALTRAVDSPLWVAAVRSELATGNVSELTISLLELLRGPMPSEAVPLLAEIRSRTGTLPNAPIDLDGLSGEARLFAAIANSQGSDPAADPAAFDKLLDAWETYLNSEPSHT